MTHNVISSWLKSFGRLNQRMKPSFDTDLFCGSATRVGKCGRHSFDGRIPDLKLAGIDRQAAKKGGQAKSALKKRAELAPQDQ
jgi:hypothetical protein